MKVKQTNEFSPFFFSIHIYIYIYMINDSVIVKLLVFFSLKEFQFDGKIKWNKLRA